MQRGRTRKKSPLPAHLLGCPVYFHSLPASPLPYLAPHSPLWKLPLPAHLLGRPVYFLSLQPPHCPISLFTHPCGHSLSSNISWIRVLVLPTSFTVLFTVLSLSAPRGFPFKLLSLHYSTSSYSPSPRDGGFLHSLYL